MVVKDIKDLKKLIDLCQKTGVESIRVDGIEIHLGALPTKHTFPKPNYKQNQVFTPGGITEETTIPQANDEELTEEQLLFYSAQGHIDNETV